MSRRSGLLVLLTLAACGESSPGAPDSQTEPDFNRCFDGQPRPLQVVIDSMLSPPAMPTYECAGDAGWGDGACLVPPSGYAVRDGDLNLALRYMGLQGWWPMIEATESGGARLCGVRFSDVGPTTTCADPVCASSGDVTLSRFPTSASDEGIAVVVDVGFPNGARMRAEFAVPDVRESGAASR